MPLNKLLGIQVDLSVQEFFSFFVAVLFLVIGLYALITGKMKTDPTSVHQGSVVSGIKARIMGLLLIILASLISGMALIS